MSGRISKSEQKRLFKQVEELAREMAELSDNDLKTFPGADELREEIVDCRNCKGGARKRQIKYLAKRLRQLESLEEIYAWMDRQKGSQLKAAQLLHQAEHWRDVLINEAVELQERCLAEQVRLEVEYPSELLGDLLSELPSLDERDLRRTVHQYVRSRNKTHYRELFRMIKAAQELEERRQAAGNGAG